MKSVAGRIVHLVSDFIEASGNSQKSEKSISAQTKSSISIFRTFKRYHQVTSPLIVEN
jgi:hypothetical protein